MSDRVGPISFDDSSHSVFIGRDFSQKKSYSEQTAAIIDEEVRDIFERAQAKCVEILTEHRDLLIAVAEYLLENESMDGKEFIYMCEHNGEVPPKNNGADITPDIADNTFEAVETVPEEVPAEESAENDSQQ